MPASGTRQRDTARYALQIQGEQDEYGLSENAFRFEASLAGLAGQADLGSMHGLLLEHEGIGDICVQVLRCGHPEVRCKPVTILHGRKAARAVAQGVDVTLSLRGTSILLLHHPTIIDIDSRRQPGTRLISSLRRHLSGRSLEVVVDLGTSDEDTTFNDYFFPDLELLGLEYLGSRLLHGRWGPQSTPSVEPYRFGVSYVET